MTTDALLKELKAHDVAITFMSERGKLYASVVLDNEPLGWAEVPKVGD